MANKIAVLEEVEETNEGTIIIREKEDYFNKVYAVESKELKFFFENENENHNLMYAYCLQGNFSYPKRSAELTFLYLMYYIIYVRYNLKIELIFNIF